MQPSGKQLGFAGLSSLPDLLPDLLPRPDRTKNARDTVVRLTLDDTPGGGWREGQQSEGGIAFTLRNLVVLARQMWLRLLHLQ